jgi:hypothetical protein
MAKTEYKSDFKLEFSITLKLTIAEARMLAEMVGYGAKPFLEGYYRQLGKSYLQPHEKAVYSFFETIKSELPQQLYDIDKITREVNKIEGLNCQFRAKQNA